MSYHPKHTYKYIISIITLVLNLAKIDWSVQIFWEFSQNYLTQANFDLSSWNFARKCSNTEWCLVLNFVKISRILWIVDEFKFFLFFFIVTSNFQHSIYSRSFLCEEAKIKQRTSSMKKICGIGEEAIWESRFTPFFIIRTHTVGIRKI